MMTPGEDILTSTTSNRPKKIDYGSTGTWRDENDHLRAATDNDFEEEAGYWNLLKKNRPFRLYLASYCITHSGEWLTYIASISLAEEFLSEAAASSRTTISILVMVRLLPTVLLSPFGGILADGRDRRESMIFLDILGSFCPLLFLVAMHFRSIGIIYLVTFVQCCIAGLYEPCVSAILPQMVADMPHSDDYLKKATTLAGLSWSLFMAVGSSLGGLVLTLFGFRACFIFDAATYLTSAFIMYRVGGTWNVADSESSHETLLGQIKGMAIDGCHYLNNAFFGGLVFLKASGAIIYGGSDVLNVSFSQPNGIDDPYTAARLGTLFACTGIGCLVGPLIADQLTDMKQSTSLQIACITAMAASSIGFACVAFFEPFWTTCLFSVIRAAGASVNWIDSSILLQKFSTDEMMGRVLSVDFALALLTEAISAYAAGFLQDYLHMDAHQVALVMGCVGFVVAFVWLLYHLAGRGAGAAPKEIDAHPNADKNAGDERYQGETALLA